MSDTAAVQVHCPFCNGVQSSRGTGEYQCEFCLQPFSLIAAQKEESRLLDEIKRWIDQKVGSGGMPSGSVDATSRSYIFGQRIFPDLKRDVDRALETLGGYGQHGLVRLPIALTTQSRSPNPLIANRRAILSLKDLRARLSSPQVVSFAATADQQASVQTLDRRLAEVTHLSNIVEASAKGGAQGYAGAKRNLLSLLEDVGEALTNGDADPPYRLFLGGLQQRYRALAELCSVCEAMGSGRIEPSQLSDRIASLEKELREAATAIKDCDYSPADSVPMAMGTVQEANGCALLRRWLSSYGDLNPSASLSFDEFLGVVDSLSRADISAEAKADVVETWGRALSARMQHAAVPAYDDFSWLEATIEANRAKKTFGFLGTEEQVVDVQRFLLPVWVGTMAFSKSEGRVFKEGVESRCLVIANACAASAAGVAFIDERSPIFGALTSAVRLSAVDIALPQATQTDVAPAVLHAARTRPEFLNSQVKIETLGFLAAALVTYDSKNGRRTTAFTGGGALALDANAATHIEIARKAIQAFQ